MNAAGFTGNGITIPTAAEIQNIVDIGDAFGVNLSGELAGAISDTGDRMMTVAPSLVATCLPRRYRNPTAARSRRPAC